MVNEVILKGIPDSDKELEHLIKNVNPRATLPRHFDLWSRKMQVMWLKQNQKMPKKRKATK